MSVITHYGDLVAAHFERCFAKDRFLSFLRSSLDEMGFWPGRVTFREGKPFMRFIHKRCYVVVDVELWPYEQSRYLGWIYVRTLDSWREDVDCLEVESAPGFGMSLSGVFRFLKPDCKLDWREINITSRIHDAVLAELRRKPTAVLRWPLDLPGDERWKLKLWED